jgi:hypothetical protein
MVNSNPSWYIPFDIIYEIGGKNYLLNCTKFAGKVGIKKALYGV